MNVVSKCGIAICSIGLLTSTFAQDFCKATHSGTTKPVSISKAQGADGNNTGSVGDYHYEQWTKSGNASATFYSDGSFSCDFTSVDDYLCRSGLFYGSNSGVNPLTVGAVKADYSMSTFSNSGGISYAYAGVYGWMQNPLIEWYIVDSWGPASKPTWLGTSQGTITVDGDEYEIFTASVSRANIEGNGAFDQIYSLRKTARTCGTIDISAHFKAWQSKGITVGTSLYEAKVLGEAGQYPEFSGGGSGASGKIDFNYAKVYIDKGGASSSTSATPSISSSASAASSASVTPGNAYSSASVPGKVEFENYDIGAYSGAKSGKEDYAVATMRPDDDVDVVSVGSGYGVGNIQPNQWMEYTVNVTGTGKYFLTVSAAKGNEGNSGITFLVDGADWGSVTVVGEEDETWSNYKEYKTTSSAQLTAGTHVIRAVFEGYCNVDYFELTADGDLVVSSSTSVAGNSSASASGDKTALVSDIRMLVAGRDVQVFDLQGKYLGKVNVKSAGSVAEALKSTFKQSGVYLVKQGSYIQRISVK